MAGTEKARFEHARLDSFSRAVLTAAGLSEEHAAVVTDVLLTANLRGVDTHGVNKLEKYVHNLSQGGFNADPQVDVERTSDASIRVDADDGPGHVAALEGTRRLVEIAEGTGGAFGTIANSNHIGMLGYYTMQAANEDCIGMITTNTLPLVAPFGGIDPVFGTNPIAASVPTRRDFHVTLDMATSITAMNSVARARENGDSIPPDWAIDSDGNGVTDPDDVHALLPFGAHKGYGLALLVDVLSGVLSGMGPSVSANSLSDYETPQTTGQFLCVIDPGAFTGFVAFERSLETLLDELKTARTRPGVDEVMLPGEIEANVRRDRERNGVPLSPSTLDSLRELADRYGVRPVDD